MEKETPIVHTRTLKTYKKYTNNPLNQESLCEKSLAKRGLEPGPFACGAIALPTELPGHAEDPYNNIVLFTCIILPCLYAFYVL